MRADQRRVREPMQRLPQPHRHLVLLLLLAAMLLPGAAHAGGTFCPGPNTVEGIDISVWQGNINWPAVKADGKYYASIRVSDGTYLDTKFAQNWQGAKAAGVIRGVYQFFEPALDPIAQADLMLSKTGPYEAGDLPPMLDVEATGGQTPATVAARITTWVNHVKAATGRDPIIYTGKYFWNDNVQSNAQAGNPLWHAQYCNCCPSIANPWNGWAFWQYTSTGTIGGIAGNVDHDKWNGTLGALQQFVGQQGCTPHCEGSVMVDASCGKGDCAPYGATCVNDDLGLRCISVFCPAKGASTVCLPSANNGLIGTCNNGAISQGDCAAFGAWCTTKAGPAAKCASIYCSASPQDAPQVKDVCLPTGDRAHCDAAGNVTPNPCPAAAACNTIAGQVICGNPIVAMADLQDGTGYWALRTDGSVEAHGMAPSLGGIAANQLKAPVVGIAAAASGKGYWVAEADGNVTAFGDAAVLGGVGGQSLPGAIVGIRRAGSSGGYWLAGSDGSVYGFGGAAVPGSMAGKALSQPIVGIESTTDGAGYWLAGSDGGVFAFGSAVFYGSLAGTSLASPIAGITRSLDGKGYWLFAKDGTLYGNADSTVTGSPAGSATAALVGMAHHAFSGGYWLLDAAGKVYDYPGVCMALCVGSQLTGADCSVSDCGGLGGACVTDANGPHCISSWCPLLGTFFTCLPDPNHVLAGTCQNGTLVAGSCKAGEQWCSDVKPSGPGCVASACVAAPDAVPAAHDVCLADGSRAHCDGEGQLAPLPCPAGFVCTFNGNATCTPTSAGADAGADTAADVADAGADAAAADTATDAGASADAADDAAPDAVAVEDATVADAGPDAADPDVAAAADAAPDGMLDAATIPDEPQDAASSPDEDAARDADVALAPDVAVGPDEQAVQADALLAGDAAGTLVDVHATAQVRGAAASSCTAGRTPAAGHSGWALLALLAAAGFWTRRRRA